MTTPENRSTARLAMPGQTPLTALLVVVALMAASPATARQFRHVVPIATPAKHSASLPDGAKPVEKPQALSRDQVRAAVDQVLSKWNTSEMEQTLADNFFDRTRLSDAMDTVVPRDATLRVQSVQGVQTLQQYIMPSNSGDSRVSIVSATVRTQVEFNDPDTGFVSLPGLNEFVLKVTQTAGN